MTRTESHEELARKVLRQGGPSLARRAGIALANRPSSLYQLLVLSTLLSARISADIAIAAARELFAAGLRTPAAMSRASWQDRVDALGRGHYRRYDERTATMLGDGAGLLISRWRGDLRRLRADAGGDADRMAGLMTAFPGIGPAGAGIFLREVQALWPEVFPQVDARVQAAARKAGLPSGPAELARLAGSAGRLTELADALLRLSGRPSRTEAGRGA